MVGFADKEHICVFWYDAGTNEDIPALVIGKRINGVITIVAEFIGDEAIQEYKKLKEMRKLEYGREY